MRAALDAMGAAGPAPLPAAVQVSSPQRPPDLSGAVELLFEHGGSERVDGALPPDAPFGYHRLVLRDGSTRSLILTPGTCFAPPGRTWGWAVQLYSARSRASWGIGDLADLGSIGRWAQSQGARVLVLNPLHAMLPGPQQPSPYFPSSRCFRNPLYLRVAEIAAADALPSELARGIDSVRTCNPIDRDAIYRLKMDALFWLFERRGPSEGFERYRSAGGRLLEDFATFMALAEDHGGGTHLWPQAHRRPRSPAVERFRRDNASRVTFHAWLQWLLDEQLSRASREIDLVHDLAIGVDPSGADAWLWQDAFVSGMTAGAPPDEFNSRGQDWGLPPLDPWKLRTLAYEPFVRTIRAGFQHAVGLRIDHVMGLFRLFWLPEGADPEEGVYVRYPKDDLLDIVALESARAGAYVVGEDLGTVEPGVREEMAARRMLGYRVMWFEPGEPRSYPELSLAAVTNHDLPTIAGLWSQSDLTEQERLGLDPDVDATTALRARIATVTEVDDDAPVDRVVERLYGALAEANSAVIVATLEDALAVQRRPNMPGTTGERPNWSMPLPAWIDDLSSHPGPVRITAILAAARPSSS